MKIFDYLKKKKNIIKMIERTQRELGSIEAQQCTLNKRLNNLKIEIENIKIGD